MIDRSIIKAPIARIKVDTPYLKREVEAVCLEDAAYDLCIGNVEGARNHNDPLFENSKSDKQENSSEHPKVEPTEDEMTKMQ